MPCEYHNSTILQKPVGREFYSHESAAKVSNKSSEIKISCCYFVFLVLGGFFWWGSPPPPPISHCISIADVYLVKMQHPS